MFNSVALDVVIGLVFIFLLYSLLATVLSELIATWLGLRARNLKEAIDRMLNDEEEKNKGWIARWIDSLKLMKNPDNLRVRNFYSHPEIKYLGSTGIFKSPSAFKAASFSKTIMYILSGEGAADKSKIEARLKELNLRNSKLPADEDILDTETAKYVLSLWNDSYGDLVKFKLQLENWFNRSMEQATEWYKRKIQIVLLVLGFFMAWFFNADTFIIIKKLATDKEAREQMVAMASAYVENNPVQFSLKDTTASADSADIERFNKKLDSLLAIKKELDADIQKANGLLGLGGWPPDSVNISTDPKTNTKRYDPEIDIAALSAGDRETPDGTITFNVWGKIYYFFRLLCDHFWGFVVTAIAISLGAPFWFDLLNKLMKLRTSAKHSTDTVSGSNTTVSPLNREG